MAAMKAAQFGLSLLQNEKPHSSISALIDILTLDRYDEDDYEGITELVEVTNLQATGPAEASRAIRKKLKYSNVHGQLRALTILKALVENCGTRFQSTFANERLVERIKLIAGDPHTDERVKKKIMATLASWYRQFKDDPRMQLVAGLYASCGGGKKVRRNSSSLDLLVCARTIHAEGRSVYLVQATTRTGATEAYERERKRYEEEAAARTERKAAEQRAKLERMEAERKAREEAKNKAKKGYAPKTRRPKFDFQAEKPKIMSAVGSGTQAAQALINALQLVNREKESVTTTARVQECLAKAKADRKVVVRYIQLVDNDAEGDYIGALIATNEQVLAALALYDRMSKPIDLDSDDEEIAQAKMESERSGLTVPSSGGRGGADDDDTTSIRSRLSAFEMRDREVDKLQIRQRQRVQRAVSNRQMPTLHPDLQDLAFGSSSAAGAHLPPPIVPRSREDTYRHGSLSDYSDSEDDYLSSDGEPYHGAGAPPTSASASTSAAGQHANASAVASGGSAKSYAQFIQAEDRKAGKGKGLFNEPEEDDPFADPTDDDGASLMSVNTPGLNEGKRMDWKQI
ncbi:BZ3500_MvSof-1268-A1-R1_Chr7-3g09597 [Microbotryum saponariae]|uniref:BZ3500_MvSof-1268-A1-R1_Chr7-3g09597 protein n=1 Tax=Microbotryum saponariae TaxID=289078 RepID=A0A2X0L6D8_9BASI|nr:BZ3501_MvSof-1269-A2-R1_Chr7-2g09320 [Microbotryum saponariae]SDA02261.1 BZ3500_MvSof-1268-A1-R1_Chr7-3g09597 [Microbotryum saponariae]